MLMLLFGNGYQSNMVCLRNTSTGEAQLYPHRLQFAGGSAGRAPRIGVEFWLALVAISIQPTRIWSPYLDFEVHSQALLIIVICWPVTSYLRHVVAKLCP